MLRTFLFVAFLQQATAGSIPWDTACGVSKGCFPSCTGGCEYLVTWALSGSQIAFTLQVEESDTDVYLAIGFSEDKRMGDDSVVGCIPSSGNVISAFNDGLHTEVLSPDTLGLSGTSVSQSNGVITCSFTRDITNSDGKFFDLNNDYIIMLLVGEAEGTSSLGHHYVIPWHSDGKVDFNSFKIVDLYKLNSPLVKLHGITMMLAWLLFSILGIITARYNKEMLNSKTLFGSKVWFQVHRACMVAVVVLVVIGFIPIFVEVEGYSQIVPAEGQSFLKIHPIIGIIVTIFAFANPIAGLLRPKPDHKYRWVFNWGHMIMGLLTQVMAILATVFGYILERSMLSDSAIYVTVALLVVVLVASIILEVHKWKNNSGKSSYVNNGPETHRGQNGTVTQAARDKQREAGQQNGSPSNMEMEENPKPKATPSNIPFYMLIGVGLITFGLSMGILGIIAAS